MEITAENISLIGAGLETTFQSVFSDAATVYDRLATTVTSSGSGNTYAWLKDKPRIREWIGDRHIQRLDEEGYRIVNKLFEGTVAVQRTKVEDDELGHYTVQASEIGKAAAQHPDKLVFEVIKQGFEARCFDGQNFFDTDHPVGPDGQEESVSNMQAGAGEAWYLLDTTKALRPFIYQERTKVEFAAEFDPNDPTVFRRDEFVFGTRSRGNAGYGYWQLAFASKAELNSANLSAALTAMQSFKSHNGQSLNVSPNVLLVSPSNRSRAKELIGAEKINDNYNEHQGAFELIVAQQLA